MNPRTDINAYAQWTEMFWNETPAPIEIRDLAIMGLGLAGESGETVEHIKKHIRNGEVDVGKLKLELGDVLYYWARICRAYGVEPTDIMGSNIDKLTERRVAKGRAS
jgi:NTP pyrophosphatase (non-canonical NTP hydrolase)